MNEVYFIVILMLVLVMALQYFVNLRKTFKITYYETKLESRNVDIKKVQLMPWYRLWVN